MRRSRYTGWQERVVYPNSHHTRGYSTILLLNPFLESSGDLIAILFHKYHVCIAMDANVWKLEMIGGYTGLSQIFDGTPVIWDVIGCLGGDKQDGNVLKIHQLTWRGIVGLNNTWRDSGRV